MYPGQVVSVPADEKRSRRRVVDFIAFAREARTDVHKVTISELSAEGCQLIADRAFRRDELVWIKIPGLLAIQAEVVLAKDRDTACRFVSPLDQRSIDQLALASREAVRKLRGHFGIA